jgi:hypothetical protein
VRRPDPQDQWLLTLDYRPLRGRQWLVRQYQEQPVLQVRQVRQGQQQARPAQVVECQRDSSERRDSLPAAAGSVHPVANSVGEVVEAADLPGEFARTKSAQ